MAGCNQEKLGHGEIEKVMSKTMISCCFSSVKGEIVAVLVCVITTILDMVVIEISDKKD